MEAVMEVGPGAVMDLKAVAVMEAGASWLVSRRAWIRRYLSFFIRLSSLSFICALIVTKCAALVPSA